MFISCENNTLINLKCVRKVWLRSHTNKPGARFVLQFPYQVVLETDHAEEHTVRSFEKEDEATDFYDSIRHKLFDFGHFCYYK